MDLQYFADQWFKKRTISTLTPEEAERIKKEKGWSLSRPTTPILLKDDPSTLKSSMPKSPLPKSPISKNPAPSSSSRLTKCHNPSLLRSYWGRCYHCQEKGHWALHCPTYRCLECQRVSPGHYLTTCPKMTDPSDTMTWSSLEGWGSLYYDRDGNVYLNNDDSCHNIDTWTW